MARRVGLIPLLHVLVGVAMTVLVILWHSGDGDPVGFLHIVQLSANGAVAYRDYPVEYPPLALVPMGLPMLLGGTTPGSYQTIFSVISLVLAVATGAVVWWLARHRWSVSNATDSLVMYVGLALAATPLVIWRFDILPALLTALALAAYAAGRSGFSGLALGLGIVTKAYPGFLVPVLGAAKLFERLWRDATALAAAAGIAVAVVLGEGFLVAGSRVFYFLVYQRNRGTEIESITGGIAMLAGAVGGVQTRVLFEFGSMEVNSPVLSALARPELVIQIVVVFALVVLGLLSFWRDVRATGSVQAVTLVQYSVATILVVILVNKVLSPQYIVWLLPFAPLMGPRKSLFFLAIAVLTTFEYPLTFAGLQKDQAFPAILLNVRNALLVAFFVWVVIPRRAPPAQNEATFEMPPIKPAATPNISKP